MNEYSDDAAVLARCYAGVRHEPHLWTFDDDYPLMWCDGEPYAEPQP